MDGKGIESVIFFPDGIPGFEELKEFSLNIEEDTFLARMDAVANREIAFFLIRSQLFFPEYLPQVDLSPRETEILDIAVADNVDVWNIITVHANDLAQSTVNLRAPLILNARTHKGVQLILSDEIHSSRQPLFPTQQDSIGTKNDQEGAVD